ncbi:MAG TPA: DUF2769 domain-containing protein [Methanobacteriaceae archaeon]|nr:DUF2769 domain-containing protein [Methanobacteriaceae archaeon]
MDKFEEALEKMSEMPEKQLKTLIGMEKKKICICRTCPTYNQCLEEKKEALFCILGKTSCDIDLVQCECEKCPAHANFQLRHDSYCLKGSELDQREKIS